MGLDAGVGLADRRHPQVEQSRRRGAQQHNFVLQLARCHPFGQHIGRRDIAKRAAIGAARPPKRHQSCHPVVHRNGQCFIALFEQDALQAVVIAAEKSFLRKTRRDIGQAHQHSKHRQRQRLVILALVFRQQGKGADDPIAFRDGVEEAAHRRGFGKCIDIRTVAIPAGELDGPPFQCLAVHHRCR